MTSSAPCSRAYRNAAMFTPYDNVFAPASNQGAARAASAVNPTVQQQHPNPRAPLPRTGHRQRRAQQIADRFGRRFGSTAGHQPQHHLPAAGPARDHRLDPAAPLVGRRHDHPGHLRRHRQPDQVLVQIARLPSTTSVVSNTPSPAQHAQVVRAQQRFAGVDQGAVEQGHDLDVGHDAILPGPTAACPAR